MSVAAGQKIRASMLNRLQPVFYQAGLTATQGLTTTTTDLAGASVTFSTTTANAFFVVFGTFVFDITSAATSFAQGKVAVDGVTQTNIVRWAAEVNTDFDTATQTWTGTLAAAGSHTIKLQADLSAGATMQCLGTHTQLLVMICEVP